jgi:hypothetical protein
VSNRGESQWVKNVRSDPYVTLTTRFGTTRYVAAGVVAANATPGHAAIDVVGFPHRR